MAKIKKEPSFGGVPLSTFRNLEAGKINIKTLDKKTKEALAINFGQYNLYDLRLKMEKRREWMKKQVSAPKSFLTGSKILKSRRGGGR